MTAKPSPSTQSETSTRRVESSVSTARDEDVRVVAPVARDAPAVLRLELVVELLGDALAQLVDERLAVEAGAEALDERDERAGGAQVGVDRLHDAGVTGP